MPDPIDEGPSRNYGPTAPLEDAEPVLGDSERQKLSAFLRGALGLAGPEKDRKPAEKVPVVRGLLRDRHRPIVLCRVIATTRYVAQQVAKRCGACHAAYSLTA